LLRHGPESKSAARKITAARSSNGRSRHIGAAALAAAIAKMCLFEPASERTIARAHDPKMVKAILSGRRRNGHDNTILEVSRSCQYTVGSIVAAAKAAFTDRIVCSPTSGFHHAGYDYSEGFCTFNGLMVTAMKLKKEGLVKKVGIIDCDFHYGDGTQDIIERLGLDWVIHRTSGAVFHGPTEEKKFIQWLERSLVDMLGCDLILFQAGQDMHIDDPLGGVLDGWGIGKRDRVVRDFCHHDKIPLAWNLAGGYMPNYFKTIEGHSCTFTRFED
jgi:acetoin utilization deacetylase AcuC-like enzyme